MKKHLYGLMIFGLIVGTAISVQPFLFAADEIDNSIKSDDYTDTARNSCWKMKRRNTERSAPDIAESGRIQIRQAVLDWDSKQLNWEIYNPQSFSTIALHLFVKDSNGVRYIATDVNPLNSGSSSNILKYSNIYSFRDLRPNENLYAVPEAVSRSDAYNKNFSPVFDQNLAVPVTVLEKRSFHIVSKD